MANFFSLNQLGLNASATGLLAQWLAAMQAAYPGYAPSSSNLEYLQAQIFSSFAADMAQLCSNGATELFRTFGTTLVGVDYQQGVDAQAVISITAQSAPSVIATTSGALSTGGPTTSIPVVALAYGVAPGSITITDPFGGNPQTFTTAGTTAGATFIPVSSATPGFAYPIGSTVSGTQAYLLPSLSQFTLDQLGFQNQAALTINSGTSQNVTVTAVQTGTSFNGAGSQGSVQSVQQLPWVSTTAVISVAAGGVDPEDDPHYLNRLTTALQLQAPRPITAADYGAMSLNFTPFPGTDQQEVGRATAVDGYNPNDGTFGNERMVTVCVTDASGLALNSDTIYGYPNGTANAPITTVPNSNAGWGVTGWLESFRELTFVVNVIDPTYSAIYVTTSVKAQSGWDALSVKQNVQAALLNFLNPTSWGLPASSSSGWQNTTTIYHSAMMAVIQGAPGVQSISPQSSMVFGVTPNPSSEEDLVLPGPVALPTSTTTTIPLSAITVV